MLAQVSQRNCGVSPFGDIQKLSGRGSGRPRLSRGVGAVGPQRFLPTPTSLSFCDSVNSDGTGMAAQARKG